MNHDVRNEYNISLNNVLPPVPYISVFLIIYYEIVPLSIEILSKVHCAIFRSFPQPTVVMSLAGAKRTYQQALEEEAGSSVSLQRHERHEPTVLTIILVHSFWMIVAWFSFSIYRKNHQKAQTWTPQPLYHHQRKKLAHLCHCKGMKEMNQQFSPPFWYMIQLFNLQEEPSKSPDMDNLCTIITSKNFTKMFCKYIIFLFKFVLNFSCLIIIGHYQVCKLAKRNWNYTNMKRFSYVHFTQELPSQF